MDNSSPVSGDLSQKSLDMQWSFFRSNSNTSRSYIHRTKKTPQFPSFTCFLVRRGSRSGEDQTVQVCTYSAVACFSTWFVTERSPNKYNSTPPAIKWKVNEQQNSCEYSISPQNHLSVSLLNYRHRIALPGHSYARTRIGIWTQSTRSFLW